MDPQRQLLCLLLHTHSGLGLHNTEQVLHRFSSPEVFWNAPRTDVVIDASVGANNALLELWREGDRGSGWQQARQWQDQLLQEQIHLIWPEDEDYPALLRNIPDRPGALYVRGNPASLALPQLAIVGSRSATRAGLELAAEFARELAAGGMAICSGLALGIDGAAHRGALAGGGNTLAVMGTGVDLLYPQRHRSLAQEIVSSGALLSEFPLSYAPLPRNFPRRNRIIAGMSLGTLVVEAAARSGSLITARLALEYNREVFAVPGSIHSPNCKGGHRLIRDGAKLVETTSHIVEELAGLLQWVASELSPVPAAPVALESHLQTLLETIDYDPTPIDTILQRSGLSSGQLSAGLLDLELGQWVRCSAGTYQRCR